MADRPKVDAGHMLEIVAQLAELSLAARRGYVKHHPDTPLSPYEWTVRREVLGLLDRHGIDLRDQIIDFREPPD